MSLDAEGKEVFTTRGASKPAASTPASNTAVDATSAPPPPVVEEEDDLSVSVAPGTVCKRKGCGVAFVSNEENRIGDGEGTVCVYHPMPVRFSLGIHASLETDFSRSPCSGKEARYAVITFYSRCDLKAIHRVIFAANHECSSSTSS